MNNYVLNCKSHFLAMFHGCARPEERRRKGRGSTRSFLPAKYVFGKLLSAH